MNQHDKTNDVSEPASGVDRAGPLAVEDAAATTSSQAVNRHEGDSDNSPASTAEGTKNRRPPAGAATSPPTSAATAIAESPLDGWRWLLRFLMKSAILVGVAGLILVLLGLAQRYKWITADGFSSAGGSAQGAVAPQGSTNKRYICPMMCTPPSSQPGRCPVCGMALVEVTGGAVGDGLSVTIEPAARRLVGIQTAVSKLSEMTRSIKTIGAIDFDESRRSTVSAFVAGRIEKLFANYAGVKVAMGDDLALIYSPQLYSAQAEFITSLQGSTAGRFSVSNVELQEMARENLTELGMTTDQIVALRESLKPQSRIRIKSPQSGTVIEKTAVEGDYIKTGDMLLRIADLSSVWLMLELFPDDATNVRFGQKVEAEIQSMPGEVFTGRVAFIKPTVNERTRTVSVRVEVMNRDGRLRPGDFATARIAVPAIPADLIYDPALSGKYISPMHPQIIRDQPGQCPLCDMDLISTVELGFAIEPQPLQRVVTVPRDAVLLTGNNGVIYVETEPGRFEIRRVLVGPMNDTDAVIVEGLAAGETVATDGNFLIDSQMQLAGNPSLLDPSKAASFAPGALDLPSGQPLLLTGEAGSDFDRAYLAYFEIQQALASDRAPPASALNILIDALAKLEVSAEVPDLAHVQIAKAHRAATLMKGSLESIREAFRSVSHALLRAAVIARGPATSQALTHYYCPMVPGGGGDWMQAGGTLANPYWGAAMLRCGEVVRDLGLGKPEAKEPEAKEPEAKEPEAKEPEAGVQGSAVAAPGSGELGRERTVMANQALAHSPSGLGCLQSTLCEPVHISETLDA